MGDIKVDQQAGDHGKNTTNVVTGDGNTTGGQSAPSEPTKPKSSGTKIAIWVAVIAAISAVVVAIIEKL